MEKSLYPQTADLPGVPVPNAPPAYDAIPSEQYGMSATAQAQPSQPRPQEQVFVQYAATPAIPPLGPQPVNLVCPSCHQQCVSVIRPETNTKTHLFAALLCILGLICCACFPYCMDSCKSTNHYCDNCNAYLGSYNK